MFQGLAVMKRRSRVMVWLALASLVACGGPKRSEDPMVRDEEITRDIKWALHRDPRFADVRVTCKQGVAMLDGVVTTEADHDRARSIAWGVSGVQEVQSRVRLRSR
jgi:osmotically-inducible protein OsmY